MNASHGMNYSEYGRKFVNQLKVEKRREKEYQQYKHMLAEIDSQLQK